jgi:hypothetical protein
VPKEECLNGKQLNVKNCKVGMRVRALAPLSSVHGHQPGPVEIRFGSIPPSSPQQIDVRTDDIGVVRVLLPSLGDINCQTFLCYQNYRGLLSVQWNGGRGGICIHNSMRNMAICMHYQEES